MFFILMSIIDEIIFYLFDLIIIISSKGLGNLEGNSVVVKVEV